MTDEVRLQRRHSVVHQHPMSSSHTVRLSPPPSPLHHLDPPHPQRRENQTAHHDEDAPSLMGEEVTAMVMRVTSRLNLLGSESRLYSTARKRVATSSVRLFLLL